MVTSASANPVLLERLSNPAPEPSSSLFKPPSQHRNRRKKKKPVSASASAPSSAPTSKPNSKPNSRNGSSININNVISSNTSPEAGPSRPKSNSASTRDRIDHTNDTSPGPASGSKSPRTGPYTDAENTNARGQTRAEPASSSVPATSTPLQSSSKQSSQPSSGPSMLVNGAAVDITNSNTDGAQGRKNGRVEDKSGFTNDEDFIAFLPDSDEDEDVDVKGKGKENIKRGREQSRSRSRSRRRDRSRDRQRNRIRGRSNSRGSKSSTRHRSRSHSRPRSRSRSRDKSKPKSKRDQNPSTPTGSKKRKHSYIDLTGDSPSLPLNSNDGYRVRNSRVDVGSRRAPWIWDVEWDSCRNVAEMLNKEVEAFLAYISPTSVEHEVRTMMVQHISNCIRRVYPEAMVQAFGSFETKLYLPSGDIDLVIQSRSLSMFSNSDKSNVLRTVANVMRRSGITDKVDIIAKARVPIIKFVTTLGRFSVDISFNQTNGVAAGHMINRFLRELPALRALVLVIKSFLNQRSMNEVFSGGLGSYSIVCLAVSFIQMHPKLRRGEIDPAKNIGVLVMEFFELYGRYFNYEETGISLRDGGQYFNKRQRGWRDFKKPYLLSIEDPGDISNDISRGSFDIKSVRQTFAGAFEIMTSAAYMRAEVLSARYGRGGGSGRSATRLRPDSYYHGRLDPEEVSILAGVMGVTQETVNHRRLIQEVYDKRILHDLLGLTRHSGADTKVESELRTGGTSRTKEAASVRDAWEEVDMDMESEEDVNGSIDGRKRGSRHDGGEEFSEGEVEESRYRVSKREPVKKKRKMGDDWKDSQTVFTGDEDEDDDEEDGLYEEEKVYSDSNGGSGGGSGARKLGVDERRAYWASKGLGGADDGGYSS